MNTQITIKVVSDSTVAAHNQINAAYEQFDYVVKKFTRFDQSSELSMLNRSQGKPTKVSLELFLLLGKALACARETDGLYDPTIIDLLELYGFKADADYKVLDDPELFSKIHDRAVSRPSFRTIKMDKASLNVTLVKDQRIDFGSLGKGYAIDLAAQKLDQFESFIINAGGDIKAKGQNLTGHPWNVGLRKTAIPNQGKDGNELWGTIELHNQSLAASGGWVRRIKFFHHLLNPSTGYPNNKISQCFVLGASALETDMWSTAVFSMGKDSLKLLPDKKLEAMIISSEGDIITTPGFHWQKAV